MIIQKKRSVSPLIAIILLIVIAVILVVAVLSFSKDFVSESLDETKSFLEESSSLRGFITSQGNINNFITISNNHSKESISVVGYRIITSTDHQYFHLLNNNYYLEEKITIDPKNIATIKVHCLPESKFNLDLLLDNDTFVRVNVNVRDYSFDMCSIYDGLVAAYDMKTIEGDTLIDVSGNGRDCTIYDSNILSDGIYFDGINSYIDCYNNSAFDFSEEVTIIAFIKKDITNNNNRIIHKGGLSENHIDFSLLFTTDNKISFGASNPTTTHPSHIHDVRTTNTLLENEWLYILSTFDGNTRSIYTNGVKQTTYNAFLSSNSNESLNIGQRTDNSQLFEGTISEIKIFNNSFSEADINNFYYMSRKPE